MAGRPDPARVAAVDEDRFEMRPIAPRLSRLKTRLLSWRIFTRPRDHHTLDALTRVIRHCSQIEPKRSRLPRWRSTFDLLPLRLNGLASKNRSQLLNRFRNCQKPWVIESFIAITRTVILRVSSGEESECRNLFEIKRNRICRQIRVVHQRKGNA